MPVTVQAVVNSVIVNLAVTVPPDSVALPFWLQPKVSKSRPIEDKPLRSPARSKLTVPLTVPRQLSASAGSMAKLSALTTALDVTVKGEDSGFLYVVRPPALLNTT